MMQKEQKRLDEEYMTKVRSKDDDDDEDDLK
jgi:hypothetical protein